MAAAADDDAFIFYWIAVNAAYAKDIKDIREDRFSKDGLQDHEILRSYFWELLRRDGERKLNAAVCGKLSTPIQGLSANQYVFRQFWRYEDWKISFESSKAKAKRAYQNGDTNVILNTLFDRLYVLRNQLVHGGATWKSKMKSVSGESREEDHGVPRSDIH